MYCGVALPGSRGGALSLLFFCRRFLFQIKRKCRNARSIKVLIIVGRESRRHIFTVLLTRQRCVEVAAPYKPRVNEFVRVLWADDIRLYRALFHYSLLLITLSEAKQPLSLGLRRVSSPIGEPKSRRTKLPLRSVK